MSQQKNINKFPNETGLADRFKQIRAACGLTMDEFGKRIGVTKSYISRIESGKSFNISIHLIEDVKRVFEINPDWLVRGEGQRNVAHETLRDAPTVVSALAPADQEKFIDASEREAAKYEAKIQHQIDFRFQQIRKLPTDHRQRLREEIMFWLDKYIAWAPSNYPNEEAAARARGEQPGENKGDTADDHNRNG
jgi:transcriptional regulator with XRE-family HTH domain